MDVLTPEQRHINMSRIRSKKTKPEKAVRSVLHRLGYRFKLHVRDLPGSPDIVLPKYKTVIFVHGCFWHRHSGCKDASVPKTNTEKWLDKFSKNIARDKLAVELLEQCGWGVIIIWECEIKNKDQLAARLQTALPRL